MNDTPHETAGQTRPSLLVRIRDSADADAWTSFVEVYAPLLYRYARGRGLQDADAADVCQDILSEVARAIRTFEYQPAKGQFRNWLGLITRRRIGRQFAKRDCKYVPMDVDEPGHVDAEWSSAFHGRLLEAALERIKIDFEPSTWRAFDENWLRDRPASEVATRTGLSVAAVYVAKSRVLKRLREAILELADDVPQLVPL